MEEHIREGFPGQRLAVLPQAIQRRCGSLPVVRDLHVTDIGHFPTADHHYVKRPEGADETILIYCTDGAGWCKASGKRQAITKGQAVLIPPHTPHAYGAAGDTPWSIYWAHFRGEQADAYRTMLQSDRLLGDTSQLYVPDTQLIAQAFEEAYSYVRDGYTDDSLVGLSTSLSRLLGLLRCCQRSPHRRGRRREDKILHSIEYMRAHLDAMCSLADFAEAAQMSSSHYSHVFKEQINTSPIHFFIRLKMQRACELLDTTDQAVSCIALRVGYDDPFHFSRMFKKIIGQSPTAYRSATKG